MSRFSSQSARPKKPTNWGLIIGISVLVFVYWLVGRELQAVDYVRRMPLGWQYILDDLPLLDVFTPIVAFGLELFSPMVLRHFLPVAAGVWLGYEFICALVEKLYNLPDRPTARRIYSHLRNGTAKAIPLNRETFQSDRLDNILLRIGGPGNVLISETDAVVTEINGRYERTLGKGKHMLKQFEYVYDIIDLKQQKMEQRDVKLTTRDGIDVVIDSVVVDFRIKRNNPRPSRAYTFSFDAESVKKAAYSKSVAGRSKLSWTTIPLNVAIVQLRQEVAKRTLDELIDPGHDLRNAPNPDVQRNMQGRTRQILRDSGIELTAARIGGIMTDQRVQDKLVQFWQATAGGAGLAEHIPQDDARLQAAKENRIREEMIQNLANGLRHMQVQGSGAYRPNYRRSTQEELDQLIPYLGDIIRRARAIPTLDQTPQPDHQVATTGNELSELVQILIERFNQPPSN